MLAVKGSHLEDGISLEADTQTHLPRVSCPLFISFIVQQSTHTLDPAA